MHHNHSTEPLTQSGRTKPGAIGFALGAASSFATFPLTNLISEKLSHHGENKRNLETVFFIIFFLTCSTLGYFIALGIAKRTDQPTQENRLTNNHLLTEDIFDVSTTTDGALDISDHEEGRSTPRNN